MHDLDDSGDDRGAQQLKARATDAYRKMIERKKARKIKGKEGAKVNDGAQWG